MSAKGNAINSEARNIALAGIDKQCDQREYHHPGNAPGAEKSVALTIVGRFILTILSWRNIVVV
jgi:hypothetical protein